MVSAMYYNLIIINYIEPILECHVNENYLEENNLTDLITGDTQFSKCKMWKNYTESLEAEVQSPYICKGKLVLLVLRIIELLNFEDDIKIQFEIIYLFL